MTGTSSALAVREHGALAIETGQTRWTEMQEAAFGQLGIADAPEGDKGVFLHVSQRTGLDPFSKQIYMIGRKEKKSEKRGNQWVDVWSVKYTIQTGIEGFRVMRSRAERIEGVRGILSRPVYYDREGKEYPVWFAQLPPVAVEMTYTVRDRNGVETPYTSILRFDEYRQTRKDNNDNLVLTGQWATKPCHMLEKCVEADVYRKAFPQDFSGVQLDDAMPAADPDAPPAQPERQRVTADQARERRPQHVTATVVTPDASPAPAAPSAAPASPPPSQGAGEAPDDGPGPAPDDPEYQSAMYGAQMQFKRIIGDDRELKLALAARILRITSVATLSDLTLPELREVVDTLAKARDRAALEALLTAGEVAPGGE